MATCGVCKQPMLTEWPHVHVKPAREAECEECGGSGWTHFDKILAIHMGCLACGGTGRKGEREDAKR